MKDPILYNAIKSYHMDNENYEISDEKIRKVADLAYDRLLLRMEQLGYDEIKSAELVEESIMSLIPKMLVVSPTYLELTLLCHELTKDIYANTEQQ